MQTRGGRAIMTKPCIICGKGKPKTKRGAAWVHTKCLAEWDKDVLSVLKKMRDKA